MGRIESIRKWRKNEIETSDTYLERSLYIDQKVSESGKAAGGGFTAAAGGILIAAGIASRKEVLAAAGVILVNAGVITTAIVGRRGDIAKRVIQKSAK
jgi:hypothetical protein